MEPLRLCYIHSRPFDRSRAELATIVPRRMAHIMAPEVEVHLLHCGGAAEDLLEQDNVCVHRFEASAFAPLHQSRMAGAVHRLAKREGIQVFCNVWEHYSLLPVIFGTKGTEANVVARVVGKPIGLRVPQTARGRIRRRIALAYERFVLRQAKRVHVVSPALQSTYEERGVRADQIVVIPTGVDTDRFAARPEPPEGPFVILFVGRLVENKGVFTLLRAFARFAGAGGEARLRIVGRGHAEDGLRTLAADLGVDGYVEMSGFVDHADLPRVYRSANLLVLPSRSEGLPNVVLEALATGVPVIGSDIPGVKELLHPNRGVLVPVDDPQTLSATLLDLRGARDRRRSMAQAGRRYVEEHHSFRSVKSAYLEFLRTISLS